MEQQRPEDVHMADEISLTPPAAAVLEFTSEIGGTRKQGELTYLTSKDAYIWAGFAALMAQYASEGKARYMEDFDITFYIQTAIRRVGIEIIRNAFTQLPMISPSPGTNPELYRITSISSRKLIGESLLSYLINVVNASDKTSAKDIADLINSNMSSGYTELLSTDLISDPIIEATLALAILPFVPFSMVKRTQKGQVVYRKIQAGLWKYERARRSGGGTQMNLTFEAARIAKAIKVGMVAAFHEATKGEGDEPDE